MKKIGIIGAGISGLFIANLFKRNSNYQITVFEKNHVIDLDEGYGIQLSVNSVKLLNQIGFDKFKDDKKFNPDKINFYSIKSSNKICDLDISEFNAQDSKYTTLKRSDLVDFLKISLKDSIKTNYNISKIDQVSQKIKLTFKNNEIFECDYLIISDGVFSKSKSLISNNQTQPKFNKTLAIRGMVNKSTNIIDKKNISLFLGSNFHYVIYPLNQNGDFNFIAIMKYDLSLDEQKNYSLFSNDNFISSGQIKTLSDDDFNITTNAFFNPTSSLDQKNKYNYKTTHIRATRRGFSSKSIFLISNTLLCESIDLGTPLQPSPGQALTDITLR